MNPRIKLISALAGIFVCGAVSGALVTWAMTPPPKARPPMGPRPLLEQFARNQASRLVEQLKLTEEQRRQFDPLMERTKNELSALDQDARKQTAQVFERLHADLNKILTPEQRTKFTKLREQQLERMRKHIQQNGPRRNREDGRPGQGVGPGQDGPREKGLPPPPPGQGEEAPPAQPPSS